MQQEDIINKIKELFKSASPEIRGIILGDSITNTVKEIGEKYKIDISHYVDLKNIIILTLLGEITGENILQELKEMLFIDDNIAKEIAKDLDETIFDKVRLEIGTKEKKTLEIKEIKLVNDPIKEKLREQLMNRPLSGNTSNKSENTNSGNRNELLEKLKILQDIPNNEVIIDRLEKIKEQIKLTKEPESSDLDSQPLNENMVANIKEEEGKVKENIPKTATYSKPPVKYNIDPYRETTE